MARAPRRRLRIVVGRPRGLEGVRHAFAGEPELVARISDGDGILILQDTVLDVVGHVVDLMRELKEWC